MKQRKRWLGAGIAVVALAGCGDGASSTTAAAAGANAAKAGNGSAGGNTASTGGASTGGASTGGASTGGVAGHETNAAGASMAGTANGGAAGSASGGTAGATGGTAGASAGMGGTPGEGGMAGQATGGGGAGSSISDAFGIPLLRRSKSPGYEWTSLHWGTGDPRSFTARDPSDPTGWSTRRGDIQFMEVDGDGVMSMGGPQPRLYIQPKTGESAPFFRDIEFTGYYRRTENDGASNSGFSVGLRAHLNGHGTVDHCLASTYYLIFRNSGTWIFDKELDHPADSPRQGGSLGLAGGTIPIGKWIGMKYLAYNLPGNNAVKLEAYIDAESDGVGTQLGNWKKLGETVDNGDWDAPAGDCGFPSNTVVTEGGGVVFIRNTAVTKVQYTKVSWREIVDAAP